MKTCRASSFIYSCLGFIGAATVLLTLTGCVTRGYKLADKSTPAVVPLELSSAPIVSANPGPSTSAETAPTAPPLAAATLHTVIIYQGPGSWKREAYWDEYIVSLTNRGEAPLVISTATLASAHSEPVTPGEDPWKLDRAGKTWWQSNAADQTKTMLLLGTGTVAGAGVAVAGALSGGFFSGMTTAGAAAVGVGTAAVVALPVVAVGSVAMNIRSKHRIEEEFTRRRLVLPLSLAPGQTVTGSLFFRITPAPLRLTLNGRAENEAREVSIDLNRISGLHLALPVSPVVSKL